MKGTERSLESPEAAETCFLRNNPLCCLEKVMQENPKQAICWCVGIGLLLGWKLTACLHRIASKP